MFREFINRLLRSLNGDLFVIRFEQGHARLVHGRVPPSFLEDCGVYAAERGLQAGSIRGRWEQGHVRLRFSGDMPTDTHQRFRNIMKFHEAAMRRLK